MPIRVKCENCKKTLSVKDQLAGKKIKCPVCQNVVLVSATPAKGATPAAPAKDGDGATTPGAKKAAIATKPAKSAKPAGAKPQTNGKPGPGKTAPTNGAAASGNGAAAKSE